MILITMAGWSLWSNVFPRGTGMESDAVTVDYYEDFSKISSANYRQAFEKAHPGKEVLQCVYGMKMHGMG